MIGLSQYPVRPRVRRGESLAGYVFRMHSVNGHGVSKDVWSLLAELYRPRATVESEAAKRKTEELLGDDRPIDRRWLVNDALLSWWPPEASPCWLVHPSWDPRMCPRCLDTFGMHLAIWELPLVGACPIHGCELITRCVVCQARLSWRSMKTDWSCRCGAQIVEMQCPAAAPAIVALSTAVAGACDVQRPEDWVPGGTSVNADGVPRIETIYRRLFALHELKRFIVAFPLCRRSVPHLLGHFDSRARLYPHGWEGHLLQRWPDECKPRLLRLAQRQWRGVDSLLVVAWPGTPVSDVIEQVGRSRGESWISDPVRRVVAELVGAHRAVTATRTLVFFNPRLSRPTRDAKLRLFAVWWQATCQTAECLPHAGDWTDLSEAPSRDDKREKLVIDLLSALVECALAGAEVQQLVAVLCGWPSLVERVDVMQAEALLPELAERLMRSPISWLLMANEQVCTIERASAHERTIA